MTCGVFTVGGLSVAGLSYRVGTATLVDHAAFEAPTGTLTALVGPNGAGKSTLLRLIAGVLPPDDPAAAQVTLAGADLLSLPRKQRARRIALLEQQATTEFTITVRRAVALGRIPHGSWRSPDTQADAVAWSVMARVGVADWADRALATLSGGEQQRVHLARALAQQPSLLLLDEPTNHLDVAAQLEMFALLRELADEQGLTVVIALHDLAAAALHCDRAVVMQRGDVMAAGPAGEALDPALLQHVYGVVVDVLTHPRTGRPVVTFDRV